MTESGKYSFKVPNLTAPIRREETSQTNVRVLNSTIAGSWYPGTNDKLASVISSFIDNVPDSGDSKVPNVLILPHAGYIYSGQTAAYGIKRILNADFDRVILLAPSHRTYLHNQMCAPEAGAVETPFGKIPVDRGIINQLAQNEAVVVSDSIHAQEHSTQIQYPFLQYALRDFKIVPLIVGDLNREGITSLAELIRPFLNKKTLLLISSDFTHFGSDFQYVPFRNDVRENVEKLDMGAYERIKELNLPAYLKYMDNTGATICGRNPIALFLELAPRNTSVEMLHYETSSDDDGDYSRFVCYMTIAANADWPEIQKKQGEKNMLTDSDKRKLLEIARKTIANVFETGKAFSPRAFEDEATDNMKQKMGAFVTLKMRDTGMLRGCIGEIEPMRPLYEAVTARAVDSAFRDPRFRPLTLEEFSLVTIEISALTPSRKVDGWKDIVIGKHGMTVSKYGRSAVFLPQVAPEEGWTLEQTLTHLSMKAGLGPDDWKEGAEFTVFEAIVFSEESEGL